MGEALLTGREGSGSGGRVYKKFYQVFTENTSFTAPECKGQIFNVMCFGGGGGGADKGGGGGGNMTMKNVEVGAGTVVQISIGAGGSASKYLNNTNTGQSGGTTSFGIYASATGGSGGNLGNGGSGGAGGSGYSISYSVSYHSGRGYQFGGGGGYYSSSDGDVSTVSGNNGGKWGGGGGLKTFGGGAKWNNVVVETIVGPANEKRWVNNFNFVRVNNLNGNTGWNNSQAWFNVTSGNTKDVVWYSYEKQLPCGDSAKTNNNSIYAYDGINTIGWTNVFFDPIRNKYLTGYCKNGGICGGGGGFGGNGGVGNIYFNNYMAGGGGGYGSDAKGGNNGGGGGGFGNAGDDSSGGGGGGYGGTGYGHGGKSKTNGKSGIVVISYEQLVFE